MKTIKKLLFWYVFVCVLVPQLCPTLCDPMDGSLQGFSVYCILLARILEWVAIPFFRGSPQSRGQIWISCMAGRFFTIWATREQTKCSCYKRLQLLLWSQINNPIVIEIPMWFGWYEISVNNLSQIEIWKSIRHCCFSFS